MEMQNATFHSPAKTIFGAETIARLDTLVPNDARVLDFAAVLTLIVVPVLFTLFYGVRYQI